MVYTILMKEKSSSKRVQVSLKLTSRDSPGQGEAPGLYEQLHIVARRLGLREDGEKWGLQRTLEELIKRKYMEII